MKKIFIFLFLSFINMTQSQTTIVIDKNENKNISSPIKINKMDLFNLSLKNKTVLLYTFSIKCEPCILHLKNAIELSEKYKIDLYVLLVEKKGKYNQYALSYLHQVNNKIKILLIKDEYGKNNNISYKKFLTDITPKKFENINDFSKYILVKNGKVIMVTNYKDNEISDDWKDDMPMIRNKIIPFLLKK